MHQVTIIPQAGATGSLSLMAVPIFATDKEAILESGSPVIIPLAAQKTVIFSMRVDSVWLVPSGSSGLFDVVISSGTDVV